MSEARGVELDCSLQRRQPLRVFRQALMDPAEVRPGRIEARFFLQRFLQLLLRLAVVSLGDEAPRLRVVCLGEGTIQLEGAADGALGLLPGRRLLVAIKTVVPRPIRLPEAGPSKRGARVRAEGPIEHVNRVVETLQG